MAGAAGLVFSIIQRAGQLRDALEHNKCVAVGDCGIDYSRHAGLLKPKQETPQRRQPVQAGQTSKHRDLRVISEPISVFF